MSRAAGATGAAASPSSRSGVRRPWTLLLPVGLVTFGVFLPSLWNDFVQWDDGMSFLENPEYRGLAPANLRWMFTTFLMGHYQPLSWVTLGLDYVIWGMDPFGYHLTNVVLHSLAAAAFAWCAASFYSERAGRDRVQGGAGLQTPALLFGAVVALLWSLHPLRVEGVTWITERREVLCGLLTLLAVASHLRGGRRWVTALLALLAMLAKATAVTIPILVVLVDLYRAGPVASIRALVAEAGRAIARHAHLVLMAAVFSVVAVFAQRDAKAMLSYSDLVLWRRLVLSFCGVGFGVVKTFAPTGLAPLHQGNVGMTWEFHAQVWWQAALGLAVVAAGLVAGVLRRGKGLGVLCLTLAYLAMVAPTGGLGQSGVQAVADRYTYQAGWVLTLALALGATWNAAWVRRWWIPWGAAATGVVLALLATVSIRQQGFWRDTESLWKRQIEIYPASPLGNYQLGFYYLGRQPPDFALAESLLRRSLAVAPDYLDPKCALAGLLISTGRPDEGIALLESALRTKPAHLPALFVLAKVLWDVGRRDDALGFFEKLATHDPRNPESFRQLAKAQAAAGRPLDAVATFARGAGAAPAPELLGDFAWLLATHPDPAVRNGRRALDLAEKVLASGKPEFRTIVMFGAASLEAGEYERGIREVEAAIPTLPPEREPALRQLLDDLAKRQPVRAEPRFP